MQMTIAQKILSRRVGRPVDLGEIIMPEAELVTCHDWYAANFAKALEDADVNALYDSERVLISTDHEPVAVSPRAAERQKRVREIAQKFSIKHFYDVGRGGLGHVFPVEKGFVRPGMYVAGYDTHVTSFGAVGALGIAVLTEVSELLALGSVWVSVPETVRINLTGKMPHGVTIRDVAQKLICEIDSDLIDDAVVEFGGPALASVGIDGRYTLCNTPTEIGARSSIVEPDAKVAEFYQERGYGSVDLVTADKDAQYRAVIEFDIGLLEPQVAVPPRPDKVVGVSEVAGKQINHAYIGSCASGLLEDMRITANILRDRKVNPSVRLFVTPATTEIAEAASKEGLIDTMIQAGAVMTAPGCGVCAGGRIGAVASGEVSIGTGTRNDPGRLGAHDASLYIASPATVAASAITGKITDPRDLMGEATEREAAHG